MTGQVKTKSQNSDRVEIDQNLQQLESHNSVGKLNNDGVNLIKNNKQKQKGLIDSTFFIVFLSFSQGLFDITNIGIFMYQKQILQLQPAFIQFMAGIIVIPWSIKPLFGYCFDLIMNKLKKTKYIIIITSVVRIILYNVLIHVRTNIYLFYLCLFLLCICQVFENITCEYSLVLSSKIENEKNENSNSNHLPIFYGFKASGQMLGNFFGGRIILMFSIKKVFFVASLLPFMALILAISYKEQKKFIQQNQSSFKEIFAQMKNLLLKKEIFQVLGVVFLINLTPNFDMMVTFYLTESLKFTTEDLADFTTFSTFTYILALSLYYFYFSKVESKKFYQITILILIFVNVMFLIVVFRITQQYGVSDKIFCMLTQGIQSFMCELNFMPILAIFCAFCPKNLEATSITLFTGLINLSFNLSNYFGSLLIFIFGIHRTDFNKLWIPIVVQNAYLMFSMILLFFIQFPDIKKPQLDDFELTIKTDLQKEID